jgi:methyltransferase
MLVRVVVCAAMAAARLAELVHSRRNVRRTGGDEGPRSRTAYPFIVAVHAVAIGGTLLFGRARPAWPWLGALIAVQPIRAWLLRMLGERWNARGIVARDIVVETRGPYRWIRHPNYAVIVVELAALPLAFGLWRLAAGVTVANAILLVFRIRDEEASLMELPGYRDHFERKARFIPGVI